MLSCSNGESVSNQSAAITIDTLANSLDDLNVDTCMGNKIFLGFCEGMPKKDYQKKLTTYFDNHTLIETDQTPYKKDLFLEVDSSKYCSGLVEFNIINQSKTYGLYGNLIGCFNEMKLLDSVAINIDVVNLENFLSKEDIENNNKSKINLYIKERDEKLNCLVALYTEKYGKPSVLYIPNKKREYTWIYENKVIKITAIFGEISTFGQILKKASDPKYVQPHVGTLLKDLQITYMSKHFFDAAKLKKEELNKVKKSIIPEFQKAKHKETLDKI